MPISFTSKKKISKDIPSTGVIRRVSKSIFAFGDDVVVSSRLSLVRALCVGDIKELNQNDIVKIYPDGRVVRLWDAKSLQNCIFVTNACNFKCLMCPQPPCADESSQHLENLRILSLLKGDVKMLAITGGEPTLFPDRLIEYFSIINKKFPRERVEILTNGSLLSDFNVAKKIALATPYDTCFCVSIHGDTGSLAESIMRCPKGWDKALTGICNLAKLHQQIEIRVVVTKNNAPYIEDIAQFLYRNFPFVSHIAFMGQEIIGEARNNFQSIWVEPIQYVASLDKAVQYLAGMGVNTSIYNIPLCLLPETSRRYAARSISDWKQEYKGECCGCDVKDQCCGFFTTSGDVMPTGICKIKKMSMYQI